MTEPTTVQEPSTFFAPDGIHIGALLPEGILLAYGYFNDDFQAALVLTQPVPEYQPREEMVGHGEEAMAPANYIVFLLDSRGRRYQQVYFWNLHDASNYMQERLGQDR